MLPSIPFLIILLYLPFPLLSTHATLSWRSHLLVPIRVASPDTLVLYNFFKEGASVSDFATLIRETFFVAPSYGVLVRDGFESNYNRSIHLTHVEKLP